MSKKSNQMLIKVLQVLEPQKILEVEPLFSGFEKGERDALYTPKDGGKKYLESISSGEIPRICTDQYRTISLVTKDNLKLDVYPVGKNVKVLWYVKGPKTNYFPDEKRIREIEDKIREHKYSVLIPHDKGDNF